MKAAIIISSILTIMAADARSIQERSNCPQWCSPVCGSDGKTYCNMDEFCRSNRNTNIDVVAGGTCEDNFQICLNNAPKNIQPVCGSDGQDYASDGAVECYKKFRGMSGLYVLRQGSCRMVPYSL